MTYHLTLTELAFRQLADGLTTNPTRLAACPAGVSRLPDRVEFLVHTVRWQPAPANDTTPHLFAVGADNAAHLTHALHTALSRCPADTTNAFLALGIGAATGHLAALCRTPHGIEPLHTLTLVSAGLPRISPPPATRNPQLSAIWSRTIGALGEDVYRHLTALNYAVIGCGRSGSLIASALSRLDLPITLIDADKVEPHNVGEMEAVTLADVGRAKVEAIADFLRAHAPRASQPLIPIADSVLALSALAAVKRAAVLFCCVDNPTARLATAFLAALYLKPLLDIGTGIFFNDQSPLHRRSLGADIRLVLPSRCLLCFGGIADLDQARTELLTHSPNFPISQFPSFPVSRSGSLRSLNTLAVGFALRLLEDFIGGRLKESAWLNVEFNDSGIPTLEHRTPPAHPRCPLCALTGRGDDGIRELPSVLEGM
jgi:hypothetical protein